MNDRLIRAILERGVARGEVNPDRLTSRIVSLPTDLARHELLMTLEPLSDGRLAANLRHGGIEARPHLQPIASIPIL